MKIQFDLKNVLKKLRETAGKDDPSEYENIVEKFYNEYPKYEGKVPPIRLFNEWLNDWYLEDVKFNVGAISEYIDKDGFIRIWRVIYAKPLWTPFDRNLGIYWSWDEDAAQRYVYDEEKHEDVEWKIGSIAHKSQIDWDRTIYMNVKYEPEREITLYEGVEVPIVALWREGKPVDIDEYEGKKYRVNPKGRR